MKKIVILLIIIIFLSGCSATYDIKFNSNFSSSEKITIQNFENYHAISEVEKYVEETFESNVKFDTEIMGNSYNLILKKNNKNTEELNEELKENFGTFSIEKENKIIRFIPDYQKCLNAFYEGDSEDTTQNNSSLVINVKIPFRVKEHNAVTVKDNIYTWEYNNKNCLYGMYIKYYGISKFNEILVSFVILLVVVCVLFIFIKSKKSNAI